MKNQIFENFEYRLTATPIKDYCCVEVSYLWNGRPTKRLINFYKGDKANYIKEAKKIIQNEINNGQLLKRSKKYHRVHINSKPILVTLVSLSFVTAVACAAIFTYQYLNGGTGGGALPPGTEVEVKPDVIDPSGGKYEVTFENTNAKVGEAYETKINLKQKNADTIYILPAELRKVTSNTTELTKSQYTYTLNASKTSADFKIEGQYVYGPVNISLMLVAPEVETIKLSFKGNDCTASVTNTNEDTWDWEKNVEKGKAVTINIQTADSYHLGDFNKTVTVTNKEAAGQITYTGFGKNNTTGSITFDAPVGDFGVIVNAVKDISDVTIILNDDLKSDFILRDSDNQQVDTIYIDDTNNDYTCYVESTKTKIVDQLAISIDEQPISEGWTYDSLSHALTFNKELLAEPHEIVITDAQSVYSVTFVDDYGSGLTIGNKDVSDTFVMFENTSKVVVNFDQSGVDIKVQSLYVGDTPVQKDDESHNYKYTLMQTPNALIIESKNGPINDDIRVVLDNNKPESENRITLVYDRRSAPKDKKNVNSVSFVLSLIGGNRQATIDWGDGSDPQTYSGFGVAAIHNFTKPKSIITITTAKQESEENVTKIIGLELVNYVTTSIYEYGTDIYGEYITAGNAYITAATIDASALDVMQFADCNLNTYYDSLDGRFEPLENIIHMIEPSRSHLERITFDCKTDYIPFGCCFNCSMLKEINVSGLAGTGLISGYNENGLQNAITADYIEPLAFANTFKENTGKLNRISLVDIGFIVVGSPYQYKGPYSFANCPYVTLLNYSNNYSSDIAYISAEATDIITIYNPYNPYDDLIYRLGDFDVLKVQLANETYVAFLIRYIGNNVEELRIPTSVEINNETLIVGGFGGPNFLNPIMKKTIKKVTADNYFPQILSGTFDGASFLSTVEVDLPTFVGARAFRGTALKEVVAPISTTSIEAETFADCLQLETVNFEFAEGLLSIGCLAFNNCPLLAANENNPIVIPQDVDYIMAGAFGGNNIAKGNLQIQEENSKYSCVENTIIADSYGGNDIVVATPYSDFSKIENVSTVYCGAVYNITFADECSDVVLNNDTDYESGIQLFAFKGAHMRSFKVSKLEGSFVILSNAFEGVTLDGTEYSNRTLALPCRTQICSYAFADSDFDTISFANTGGEEPDTYIVLFNYAFANSNVSVIDLTKIIDYVSYYSYLTACTYSINKEARIKVNKLEQAYMLMEIAYSDDQGWPIDIDRYII